MPRHCSAVTEKLNFVCAYWEDLSQPCICYCIKKIKIISQITCHYCLYCLCQMSSMFFQNLRPDDRAFKNLCPTSEIEFNCLTSIKHFVNCGCSPQMHGRTAWVESQRSRGRMPAQAGSTVAVSSTHQLLGLKCALKGKDILE